MSYNYYSPEAIKKRKEETEKLASSSNSTSNDKDYYSLDSIRKRKKQAEEVVRLEQERKQQIQDNYYSKKQEEEEKRQTDKNIYNSFIDYTHNPQMQNKVNNRLVSSLVANEKETPIIGVFAKGVEKNNIINAITSPNATVKNKISDDFISEINSILSNKQKEYAKTYSDYSIPNLEANLESAEIDVGKAQINFQKAKRSYDNKQSSYLEKQLYDAELKRDTIKSTLDAKRNDEYVNKQKKKKDSFESVQNNLDFAQYSEKGASKKDSVLNISDNLSSIQHYASAYERKYKNYMTESEKETYNYYLGKYGSKKAKEYLDVLDRDLNKRLAEKSMKAASDISSKPNALNKVSAVIGSLGTGFATPFSMVATIGQNIKNTVTGKYEPIDPYSPMHAGTYTHEAINEGLWKDVDPVWQFLGNTGLAIANTTISALFGNVGALAVMGSQAAGKTAYDVAKKGGSPQQALASGIASGAAEVLTEKIPLDNLFKLAKEGTKIVGKEAVKQVLKQAGIEATEELTTEYANLLSDMAIMGDKSEYAQYIESLKEQGISKGEAKQQGDIEFFIKKPLMSALGGAISGGVMSSGAMFYNNKISPNPSIQTGETTPISQIKDAIQDATKEAMEDALESSVKKQIDKLLRQNDKKAAIDVLHNTAESYRKQIAAVQNDSSISKMDGITKLASLHKKLDGLKQADSDIRNNKYIIDDSVSTTADNASDTISSETISQPTENADSTEPTKTQQEFISKIAESMKPLGIKSVTLESMSDGTNGFFDKTDNSIHLSDKLTDVQKINRIIGHELTHYVGSNADTTMTNEILEAVKDTPIGDMLNRDDFKTSYTEYISKTKNVPIDEAIKIVDDSYINDEMAADAVGYLLENEDLLSLVAKQKPNFIQRIWEGIQRIMERLTGQGTSKQELRNYQRAADMIRNVVNEQTDGYIPPINAKLPFTSDTQKNTENEKYSINYTVDNTPFVTVEEDILKDVPKSDWVKTVKDNLKNKFPNGVQVGNNLIKINNQSRNELTNSKNSKYYQRNNSRFYADKFKATNNVDEIVRASQNYVNEGLKHPRNDNIVNFGRGNVLLNIGNNNYSASVITGAKENGELFLYDIIDLTPTTITEKNKKTAGTTTAQSQDVTSSSWAVPATDTISQNNDNVNSSISNNSESDTTPEERNTDTKRYSIETIPNTDKKYVQADHQVVDLDSKVPVSKQIENYINEKVRKGEDLYIPTDDGDVLMITERTAYKMGDKSSTDIKTKKRTELPEDMYYVKGNAVGNLDEIAAVSKYQRSEPDYGGRHKNDFAEDGFDYRNVYFRDVDGKYYRLNLNIGKSSDGKLLYNISNIKERSFPLHSGSSSNKGGAHDTNQIKSESIVDSKTSFVDSISQNDNSVNSDSTIDKNNRMSIDVIAEQEREIAHLKDKNNRLKSEMKTSQLIKPSKSAMITISRDYINNFNLNLDTKMVNSMLDEVYTYMANGINSQYSDLRDKISNTFISVPNGTIPANNNFDFDSFRSQTKGILKFTESKAKNAKSIESFYNELSNEYPSLFPKEIDTQMEQLVQIKAVSDNIMPEPPAWDEVYRLAENAARPMIESASIINNEMYDTYTDLRLMLRTTPLTISSYNYADLDHLGGYNNFRKNTMGRLKLVKDGQSIDSFYSELTELYPELFSEDSINPADQLIRIAEVAEKLRPFESNPFSSDMEDAVQFLASDIIESFYAIPQHHTFADIQKQKLINTKVTAQNRLESVRKQKQEAIHKIESYYTERIADKREKQEKLIIRAKIKRKINEMSKMLLKPTDKQHIPENLRKIVAEFLDCIDFSTDKTGLNAMNHLYKLSESYRSIADNNSNEYMEIDPSLPDNLSNIANLLNSKRLIDLNKNELSNLYDITRSIFKTVTTQNKLLSKNQNQTATELGHMMLNEILSNNSNEYQKGKLSAKFDSFFHVKLLDPDSFFQQFGDTAYTLFKNIRNGQDVYVNHISEASEYMKSILKDIDFTEMSGDKAKIHTFTLENNATIDLNTAQIMSIYLLNKQKQAQNHMISDNGGIRRAPIVKDGKVVKAYRPVKTTQTDINTIIDRLSPQQKNIADTISKFLSQNAAEWGNEVSMNLFGYRKFTLENYFPIKTDSNFSPEKLGNKVTDTTLKEKGFTKERVNNANSPINVEDIFDVFDQHISDMAAYNAYVIPLSDFNKVYNYKTSENSIKTAIEQTFGNNALDYIRQFITDINGGKINKSNDDGLVGFLTKNYKAAAVGANISVILKQPLSYIRAASMIDPKYLTMGIFSGKQKAEMHKHSPIAVIKDWGFSDVGFGKNFRQLYTKDASFYDKLTQFTMAGAGKMDEVTWTRIWGAVKAEIHDKQPFLAVGSDEYYSAVNQRFRDIIARTQVVDTVFDTSAIMRSEKGFDRMATPFMGEPLKSYNNLRTAFQTAAKENTKTAWKKAGRTAFVSAISTIAVSGISTIMDMLRDEEDDEEKKLSDGLKQWGVNALSDTTGMIPYLKDVVSIINGWDIERMDMQGLSALFKSSQKIYSHFSAIQDGKSPATTPISLTKNVIGALSQLTGVPAKTVWRDAEALIRNLTQWSDNEIAEYAMNKLFYNIQSNVAYVRQKYMDILYKAYRNEDYDSYKRIKADMLENGVSIDSNQV